MGNCLVTKLKSVVNNDNLDTLGSVKMFLTPELSSGAYVITLNLGTMPHRISIRGNTNTALSVSNPSQGTLVDGHTIDYLGIVSSSAGLRITVQNGNRTTIEIDKKSDLNKLVVFSNSFPEIKNGITDLPSTIELIDLAGYSGSLFTSDFVGFSSLKLLNFANSFKSFEGQLSNLGNLSVLESITANSNKNTITGDIKDIGSLTHLTTFKFSGNIGISGSIEEFVAAQRLAGRTTESTGISFGWGLTNVTFNGSTTQTDHSCTLTWTTDTITYDGVTISA